MENNDMERLLTHLAMAKDEIEYSRLKFQQAERGSLDKERILEYLEGIKEEENKFASLICGTY